MTDTDRMARHQAAGDGEVVPAVVALLQDRLMIEVPDVSTDLFAEGLLDSVGIVELLLLLEERFGVQVPAADLRVEEFRSVRSIAAFVTHLTPAVPAPAAEGGGQP